MIGFIAQILHHRQFFRGHLRRDLFHDARPGDLMRQSGNHHIAIFPLEYSA